MRALMTLGASCPTPPSTLGPPPVPTIDFLGGKLRIPWTSFQTEAQRPNRGGNLYYSLKVPGNVNDPVVKAALAKVSSVSATLFKNYVNKITGYTTASGPVGPGLGPSPSGTTASSAITAGVGGRPVYGNKTKTISAILNDPNSEWTLAMGPLKVPKQPQSIKVLGITKSETAEAFLKRGGYLLYKKALVSLPGDRYPIEKVKPSWVDKHDPNIEEFWLFTIWKNDTLDFQAVLHGPSTWDKAWDSVVKAAKYSCKLITHDKVQQAAAYATIAGAATSVASAGTTAAVIGAWQAAASACGQAWPVCTTVAVPPPAATTTPTTPKPPVVQPPSPYPVPPAKWYETTKGKIGIAAGVTAAAGAAAFFLLRK